MIVPPPRWPARARWAAVGVYFAALNWLLLAPARTFHSVDDLFPLEDKLAHLGIFLVLALLVHWALPPSWAGGRRLAAIGALALYAAAIEVAQPLLTHAGRQYERLDLACNLCGVAAGWLLFGMVAARAAARAAASERPA